MGIENLSHEQKVEIYYEIEHEFDVEDVSRHVEDLSDYYSGTNRGEALRNLTSKDIEQIASVFRDRYDASLAANDQIVCAIEAYINNLI